MANTVRPPVNLELLDEIKKTYPEVEGLKAKAIVDWALRKLVKEVSV